MSIHTSTTRTHEHTNLLEHYDNIFKVKLKRSERNYHYYFNKRFQLTSEQTARINSLIGEFSYLGEIGAISTVKEINKEVLNSLEQML